MSKSIFLKTIAVMAAFVFTVGSYAQTDTLNQRIFLVGDAGELVGNTHPVVDWLSKHVNWDNDKNTVIYLGDNIYPLGMPLEHAPGYVEAKKIIDYQISLVKGKKAKAFFVPGNHDWMNGKLGGWQQVINQENYISSLSSLDSTNSNIISPLTGGCPGPEAVELSDKVVVAFIDSEWWLYLHPKPGPTSTCSARTEDEVIAQLQQIADSHPNQLLIVAMHHPMYSYGPHGGNYTLKSYFFPFTDYIHWLYIPLPVIGFIYPITRGVFGNIQDVKHPLYRSLIRQVESVLKSHTNSIHVAGHDHGLQFLIKDSIPHVVSGSGSNLSRLRNGKFSVFEDRDYGFAMLEVYNSGKVDLKYYNIHSQDINTPTFSRQLDSIKTVEPKPSLDSLKIVMPDSMRIAANTKLKGDGFKDFVLGKNYREEWITPVKVPVLNFGTERGGLTPIKMGGGKQTKSLRVKDASGKEWALRSVQKFPENAIPADLQQTFAKDLVEDGISASYPYGALSIPPMAHAVGVPALKGKLVYIPDDPRLQIYRNDFKNMLATMEEREPDSLDEHKTFDTDKVATRMAEDNDNRIDQKEVLRARLLDNFIMDFDRHEGQWNWATYDTGKGKVYYAIPKDRDQAFFTNEGLLPHLVDKPWFVPELQGFKAKADNIKTFNRPARNFDRAFLNQLAAEDWERAIDTFLMRMTDSVIVTSMMRQPNEIQHYSVPGIIKILEQKRKYFRSDMMKYYRFISKTVSITGSNKKEQFTITKNKDGSVNVLVNKIDKSGKVTSKMYERLFDPKVTKELRIYGLEDNDRFIIQGGNSPIKIRIIGGPGNDAFINEGTGGTVLVYDATFEENTFSGNSGLTKKLSGDPQVNRYDRLGFKYDFIKPGVTVEYNVDDGVFLGANLDVTLQGFRKEPFAAHHYLSATRALKTSSYHFKYNAEFKTLIGKSDLIIKSDIRAPINVTNFFGIGNNTKKEDDHTGGIRYYRAHYNIANASVLLSRQLQSWMRINYGPTFQYFQLNRKENMDKFVGNTAINGLDPKTLYNGKAYLGAMVSMDINSKNNQVLPTRGFVLNAGVRTLFGLNNSSNSVTQLNWDMRIYTSKTAEPRTRLVVATRLGVGHNIGNYAFPQAQYLSGTENLRGYRRDRFAGRTMLYNNLELRWKIKDFVTYLFPGSIGLQVFNDVGRVWADGENSKRWHDGYGIGVWVAPIKRFVVTASVAHSNEETALPLVTFGFQF